MKRIIIYTFLSLLFFSSCVKEIEEQGVVRGDEVYMNISTHSLDPSMTEVRIIVTDVESGQVLINEYPAQPQPTGEYKLSVQTGELNFYVILNEPSTLTSQLSSISNNSTLSTLILNREDLPLVEDPDDSSVKTNLPSFGWVKALIRTSSGIPKYGEASVDSGATWSSMLNIGVQRMASKVTFALRKNTPQDLDNLTLNKVTILNIPRYENLHSKAYDSQLFDSEVGYDTPLVFSGNTTEYTKVFTGIILPEYIPVNPANKDMALCLKLDVTYNQKNVEYYIPVRSNINIEDYSVKRNNHYVIKATIATEGETLHIPEIKYQVADWSDANIESEFVEETAITFSQRWGTGTDITGTDVRVENNGYVEFYFTLSYPKGGSWSATLTNNINFMFDETDGAVSNGTTREGYEYKIRVKPRREIQFSQVETEFYITVNNGIGNTELNLPDQSVGTKSRYTIIQIPN